MASKSKGKNPSRGDGTYRAGRVEPAPPFDDSRAVYDPHPKPKRTRKPKVTDEATDEG